MVMVKKFIENELVHAEVISFRKTSGGAIIDFIEDGEKKVLNVPEYVLNMYSYDNLEGIVFENGDRYLKILEHIEDNYYSVELYDQDELEVFSTSEIAEYCEDFSLKRLSAEDLDKDFFVVVNPITRASCVFYGCQERDVFFDDIDEWAVLAHSFRYNQELRIHLYYEGVLSIIAYPQFCDCEDYNHSAVWRSGEANSDARIKVVYTDSEFAHCISEFKNLKNETK